MNLGEFRSFAFAFVCVLCVGIVGLNPHSGVNHGKYHGFTNPRDWITYPSVGPGPELRTVVKVPINYAFRRLGVCAAF